MSGLLATATLEEQLVDSVHALGVARLLVAILLLAAVIRMAKQGWIGGGKVLGTGLALLIVAEGMWIMTSFQWISLSYSPVYASIREEWEMGLPDWEGWEPVYWWVNYGARWLGMMLAALGFVRAARGLVARAVQRDLAGGRLNPE